MAGLLFEGDHSFSDIQLKYIKDMLENRGYNNGKVLVEPAGKLGDNYVADVKRVTVIESDGATFKMIVKVAPVIESIRKSINIELVFRNEHLMYTEVLPKLVDLQRTADVSKDDFFRYARCYGSFTEAPNEMIFLEDLKEANFVMLDRFKSLSNESIRLVLKEIAVLHSLSYALKYNDPKTFDDYTKRLLNVWLFDQGDDVKIYFDDLEKQIIGILDSEKYKKEIRNSVSAMWNNAKKLHQHDTGSKHAIIQQGDTWTNNIMFRLQDDLPVECIMIDYQLAKLTNPVADIFYLIFNCTDYEVRSKNFYHWIDYYHSELDKSLANFGLKANFVYPRDQLDVDMRRLGKFMLGLTVILSNMLVRDSSEVLDMKSPEFDFKEKDDIFEKWQDQSVQKLPRQKQLMLKKRVEGLVDSFMEYGLL